MNTFPFPPPSPTPTPLPVKSKRNRNLGIAVAVGALVVIAGIGATQQDQAADADAPTVNATQTEAKNVDVESETTVADDARVEYAAAVMPLLTRTSDVFGDLIDISTAAGEDPVSFLSGDYIVETITIRQEAQDIYDDWTEIDVPDGLEDLDEATGAVFSNTVETTAHFADAAVAGNIDDAMPELDLTLEGTKASEGLIATAQAELDKIL